MELEELEKNSFKKGIYFFLKKNRPNCKEKTRRRKKE